MNRSAVVCILHYCSPITLLRLRHVNRQWKTEVEKNDIWARHVDRIKDELGIFFQASRPLYAVFSSIVNTFFMPVLGNLSLEERKVLILAALKRKPFYCHKHGRSHLFVPKTACHSQFYLCHADERIHSFIYVCNNWTSFADGIHFSPTSWSSMNILYNLRMAWFE
jgi:hypothetical protein